ncbi:MAG: hypothetical protein M1819_002512 [Sarea resinae]|nr:MAG: hypothetical protein M1819_002512 [Sarea resinae]
MADSNARSASSSGLPTYNGSVTNVSARAAYRRVKRVIELQWRGIAIVIIIIADVVFFSIVFVYMDATTQDALTNASKAQPWLQCLLETKGDKEKCLPLAHHLVVNQATVMAVLILLSMNGIWLWLLIGRWSMVTGWASLLFGQLSPSRAARNKREFVSADARRLSNDPRTYEMLTPQPTGRPLSLKSPIKSPESVILSPKESPLSAHPVDKDDLGGRGGYFGQDAKYRSPVQSFSSPRSPTSVRGTSIGRDWDPQTTFAVGNLGVPVAGMRQERRSASD